MAIAFVAQSHNANLRTRMVTSGFFRNKTILEDRCKPLNLLWPLNKTNMELNVQNFADGNCQHLNIASS